LVQLVAAALTETIKNKSQKSKESSMEGSDEEAADRKYQKTDSGSAKAKYFALLDDKSSCYDDNSSQSEEDPYVKAKLMVATYLMSRGVKATFVHYRCGWDSARDIQKLQQ